MVVENPRKLLNEIRVAQKEIECAICRMPISKYSYYCRQLYDTGTEKCVHRDCDMKTAVEECQNG